MKIKVNKTKASIEFETKREIECFAQICEYYMDMIYEEPNDDGLVSLCDSQMEKLNRKFEKALEY